jgi:hypothetical protein
MASVLDIISGISTVLANSYDGALDDVGEPIKIGLTREEGDPIIDSRVMDGFSCRFSGPLLKVAYSGEIALRDVHNKNRFEGEIEQKIQDIVNFLKKEYKKNTGNALTLTKQGEPYIFVQNISRLRTWVQANCDYKIGGMDDVIEVGERAEDRLDDAVRTWLGMNDNKKRAVGTGMIGNTTFPDSSDAENVKGKRDEEPR